MVVTLFRQCLKKSKKATINSWLSVFEKSYLTGASLEALMISISYGSGDSTGTLEPGT